MNQICTLLGILLLMTLTLSAQQTVKVDKAYIDVVYLKNGNIIRGEILEHMKDQYVSIQTPDQNIWKFTYDELTRITLEPTLHIKPEKFIQQPEKGYNGRIGLSTLIANGTPQYDRPVIPALYIVQSYRFQPLLNAGIGTGLEVLDRGMMLPVFAEISGDITTGRMVNPHIYVQGGYGFAVHDGQQRQIWENGQWIDETGEVKGGIHAGLGAGIRLLTRYDLSWLFTLGYKYQAYEEKYGGNRFEGERIHEKLSLQRITVSLGLSW